MNSGFNGNTQLTTSCDLPRGVFLLKPFVMNSGFNGNTPRGRSQLVVNCSQFCETGHMEDLHIPPAPGATKGLVVPAGELIERLPHATCLGGQGVTSAYANVHIRPDVIE